MMPASTAGRRSDGPDVVSSDGAAFETWRVRVRGRVQGVGFRAGCERRARQLGIAGWVRNRLDGSVELLLQADAATLERCRAWLRDGVPGARVDEIGVEVLLPPQPRHAVFEMHPTA